MVDGKISLSEASVPLLRDTLALLSCDEIKLQSLKTRPEDAEPATDVSGMAEVFQAVAKKTLISQVGLAFFKIESGNWVMVCIRL